MAGKSGRGFAGKSGYGMAGQSTKGGFGKASSHVNKTGKTGRGQNAEHHGGAWVCLSKGNEKSDATPQPLTRHAAVGTEDHVHEKETVTAPKVVADVGVTRAEAVTKDQGISIIQHNYMCDSVFVL